MRPASYLRFVLALTVIGGFSQFGYAQGVVLFGKPLPVSAFGGKHAQAAATVSTYYRVDQSSLATLRTRPEIEVSGLAITTQSGVRSVDLELKEFSVLTADAQILLGTADGEVPGPMPTVKTYRGKIRGEANSFAYLALGEKKVSGRLVLNGEEFTVGTALFDAAYSAITPSHLIPSEFVQSDCGVTEGKTYAPFGAPTYGEVVPQRRAKGAVRPQEAVVAAEIAIDADYELMQRFGSEQATIDYITARMAAISTVYEQEAGVATKLSYLKVYTSTGHPYSGLSTTDAMLNKMINFWPGDAAKKQVKRTVAHFLSGQELSTMSIYGAAGLAYVNVLCNKDRGYGVTRMMANEQFSTIDEKVVAHELGHNFGSRHTQSCMQWGNAIDSCVAPEDGSCYDVRKQITGTIMSYCSKTNFTFGPKVIEFLKAQVEATECLVPFDGGGSVSVLSAVIGMGEVEPGKRRDTTLRKFIRNSTSEPVSINVIYVTGSPDFTVVDEPAGIAILPGKTADLQVSYRPGDRGFDNAKAIIEFSNGTKINVSLTGVGIKGGGGGSKLSFSTRRYDYYEKKLGSYNDTAIMIWNNTGDSLELGQPKWVPTIGGATNYFSIFGNTKIALPAAGFTFVKIRFRPDKLGLLESMLILPYGNGQDTIWFRGTGSLNPKSVEPEDELKLDFTASPNPFQSSQELTIVPSSEFAGKRLEVLAFDLLGNEVTKVFAGVLGSAPLTIDWQPQDLAAGSYLIVARIDDKILTRRVVYQP